MNYTPAIQYVNSGRRIDFCTPAGVEAVGLEPGPWPRVRGNTLLTHWQEEGPFVVGRLKQQLRQLRLSKPGQLAEEFANHPNDEQGILRFTNKYGPLRFWRPEPGQEFRFQLSEWRQEQETFKKAWLKVKAEGLGAQIGNRLTIQNGRLRCQTSTLLGLLLADLFTCPRERLKKCSRPDCPNPYFIAHHLGQRFCSDLCAGWAQRKWKQQWWAEHGDKWRNRKRRKTLAKRKIGRTSRGAR